MASDTASDRRQLPQPDALDGDTLHQVTATTTSADKLGLLERLGAEGIVMDGPDTAP